MLITLNPDADAPVFQQIHDDGVGEQTLRLWEHR